MLGLGLRVLDARLTWFRLRVGTICDGARYCSVLFRRVVDLNVELEQAQMLGCAQLSFMFCVYSKLSHATLMHFLQALDCIIAEHQQPDRTGSIQHTGKSLHLNSSACTYKSMYLQSNTAKGLPRVNAASASGELHIASQSRYRL